jgi:ubiquinone/menaquinone biosynthesis C-methylase UbiE
MLDPRTRSGRETSPMGKLNFAQYLLATQGVALNRDLFLSPETRRDRLSEVAEILDQFTGDDALHIVFDGHEVTEGYTRWAAVYDGPNPAIEHETPVVQSLLSDAPRGVALDAACGTGRHAAFLADLGHEVIGVDITPAMLDIARQKVPGADFRLGALEALPLDDESVDMVVCALALTHVVDLVPVFAEFARVLRPDGRIVLSDMHPIANLFGGAANFRESADSTSYSYVQNRVHHMSDYLSAFRSAGWEVVDCVEVTQTEEIVAAIHPGHAFYPEAALQAYVGMPWLLCWHLAHRAA